MKTFSALAVIALCAGAALGASAGGGDKAPELTAAGERLARVAADARRSGTVRWQTYETGIALAAQLNKPMVIDFSTEWCGWCKKVEREVFPSPEFISVAQRFVCIRVDAEARRDLASKYRVHGYPTAVILDSSGRELQRIVGYKPAKDYAAALGKALPSG